MDEDHIGDILGDLDQFTSPEAFTIDKTEILVLGREKLTQTFQSSLGTQLYTIIHSPDIETAAELLLQHYFAIILLDFHSNFDLISVSNILRNNHALARIILVYEGNDKNHIFRLFNSGSFDAVINLPRDPQEITKDILAQEAKYAIQKEVTGFVSEPPKLSKASFLLLDPTLSFGDESQPINFVGIMIVVNSVPRYSVFFEETLASDEVLFAAFLSSIAVLGDELFKKQESMKEINFGGISVIFRFFDNIQVSFLVKNLNSHNYQKAEDRIDNIIGDVFEKYGDMFQHPALPNQTILELDQIFYDFDELDEVDTEEFEKEQDRRARKEMGTPYVITLANPNTALEHINNYLRENSLTVEYPYEVASLDDQESAFELIKSANVGVVIIDDSIFADKSSQFVLESFEELDPAVQKLIVSNSLNINQEEVNLINTGNVDAIHESSANLFDLFATIQQLLDDSFKIRQDMQKGTTSSQSKNALSAAKGMLKENLDAFDAEIQPELEGIVISQELNPIFEIFWEINGERIQFDTEMMTGLVSSLKSVAGEMFDQGESIDELEIAGKTVFVRFNGEFMFMYFVKNISATTSIVISKELDAITQLYAEIIAESLGMFTSDQLYPIFKQIGEKAQSGLTQLLAQK